MRVVLDTNILVSALIAPAGNPAAIYNAWDRANFTLLTCASTSTSCAPLCKSPGFRTYQALQSRPLGQPDQKLAQILATART